MEITKVFQKDKIISKIIHLSDIHIRTGNNEQSRYEEYLPHVKDVHGRYTAPESLAYNHGFLEKPVVDIWAYKLLAILKKKFPDYKYQERSYEYVSTIDIDNAFAYKHKNFIRSAKRIPNKNNQYE